MFELKYINNFERFDVEVDALDSDYKLSVLKAAPSVVCLKSYVGDERLFTCCGIIMECESRLGTYMGTILTSASLVRSKDLEAKLPNDLKIDVCIVGGISIEGKVMAVDFHYNVATIKILSDSPLPIAYVKLVDNVVEVGPRVSQNKDDQNSVSTLTRFRLGLHDKVLALARYFMEPYDIMAVSGEIRDYHGYCYDCHELLISDCRIKKNGVGGPLINLHGEVIGINFYDELHTPFLPMNIVMKCFEDFKKKSLILHPSLGTMVIDLYKASFHNLEFFFDKFPDVVKGAIITKVIPDSAAHIAGLRADDVIIHCDGTCVGGLMELTECLWGKVGKPIKLDVVRASIGGRLQIYVDALDAISTKHLWPLPPWRLNYPSPLFC